MHDSDPNTKHILEGFDEYKPKGRSVFDPFIPDNFGIIRDEFPCVKKMPEK